MTEQQSANQDGAHFDTDQDRYPELDVVLRKLLDTDELPQGPLDKVEVTMLPSGEANCRVWPARAEEPEVVYFPQVD